MTTVWLQALMEATETKPLVLDQPLSHGSTEDTPRSNGAVVAAPTADPNISVQNGTNELPVI